MNVHVPAVDMETLRPRRLLWMVVVAVAYYLSGRLGILLAIPPGYATAVWPASGIALAAVLLRGPAMLPGIWLGSFVLNASITLSNSDGVFEPSILLIPALIGLGAALQAGVGGLLIQKLIGYRNLLEQEFDTVKMLMLGGPVACLINSSVAVAALYARGQMPAENLLFNWWTWWVGDSIGVLIITPLVLVWALRPASKWLRQQLQVSVPLIFLFAGMVWLFISIGEREQARVRAQFQDWTMDISHQIESTLSQRLEALRVLGALYDNSTEVTFTEFQNFSSQLLEQREGLLALSWNPRVPVAQKSEFEGQMRKLHEADYTVFEDELARQPVKSREEYFPVAYIVPKLENLSALGFDTGSEHHRLEAMIKARDSGRLAVTEPLHLIQDQVSSADAPLGIVAYAPVYRAGPIINTQENRRNYLRGYVAAVFKLAHLIPIARAGAEGLAVELRIEDVSSAQPLLLYSSGAEPEASGLNDTREFNIGGRVWRAQFSLPERYLVPQSSWQLWTLLAAGLLFTGLLGMFLLVVIGREARVAHLVQERTAELQDANRNLSREVARSDRLETEARARAEQLSATNRELEQFAFVVSHDLQAPLRNMQSFAKLLEKRHGAALNDEAREFLGYIRSSGVDMERLISDLLQLSRVNPKRASIERVRAGEVLATALSNLRTDIEARGAVVEQAELPEVFADAGLLTQLFQNLLANAIKFQKANTQPKVKVGVELIRGEWRFSIADNGIGIAEKNVGRLFQVFRRLHTAEEYPGTGIGLALCKKIVSLHGGRIWLESKLGEGTTFFFTLPLQQQTLPKESL